MNAPAAQAHPFLSTIAELYNDQGNLTYGEDITQIEHAVQCAELAVRAGESDELISAALLHDIGHLMAATDIAFGNYKHDSIGADYLSPYFSKAVTEPIRQHAQAKRYLCSVEEGYLASLSAASLDSLKNQGGLMTKEEQLAFAATPYFVESIRLRRWDDEGKNLELSKLSIEHYSHHLAAAIKPVETWSNPMHDEAEHFQKRGYIVLPQAFDNNELSNLENEVKTLNKHAQSLLNQLSDSNQSLDDFYQENLTELIVVPEQDDPQKVCRYEYINGFSTEIKHSLVPKLQKLIKQLTGTDFVLFKDKCNEKNPGGGAFDPHQDVIAYDHFN
ncbi:MAG: phosphonate degradation associated HDIG domain protein, partial [Oceanospirillaceae bacterium]